MYEDSKQMYDKRVRHIQQQRYDMINQAYKINSDSGINYDFNIQNNLLKYDCNC